MRDWEDVKREVVERAPMVLVVGWCGFEGRKEGGKIVMRCPFHAEKSGSFVCGGRHGMEHRGHCFGCGWDGDVFEFWMRHRGTDFKSALRDLASLAGVLMGEGVQWVMPKRKKVREYVPEVPVEMVRPELPRLRHLREAECAALGAARGIDVKAVWYAARVKRVAAFAMWPQYLGRDGVWRERSVGAWPSWCATDDERWCAEFRRIDNGRYPRQDGGEIKSWSTRGKSWPVGAAGLNGRKRVLLVEGGPDMLAGYDLLMRYGMEEEVGVVCMLGAANRMREDALGAFAGCRVRIMVDADALRDDVVAARRKVPGMEAALRWQKQLQEAGAAVECFCVGPVYEEEDLQEWREGKRAAAEVRVRVPGLRDRGGTPVKDVNDLIKCGELADEMRTAARCWDF